MNRTNTYIKIVLTLLAIILIVLLAAFLKEYGDLKKLEIVSPRDAFMNTVDHHSPFTARDTALIQGWMTFDYVNKIFGLPAGYLKTNLGISDVHYPRDVIFKYAEENGLSVSAMVAKVQNAVSQFLTNKK